MQPKKKRDDKNNWLLEKYRNINTSCSTYNYDFVLKVSSEILDVYPNDDFALYSYAACLCINGESEEAKPILKHLLDTRSIEKSKYVLISLVHAEYNFENFEKAYEYLLILKKFFPQMDLEYYETFFRYKLYNEITPKTPEFFYAYDLDSALTHISNRHVNNIDSSYFNENINFEKVFSDIIKKLEDIPHSTTFNPLISLQGNEINGGYYFRYPECGYSEGHICNYLKVITTPYTKNIISIYPTLTVNSGYEIYEIEKEKIMTKEYKPISQIEKFNKRWKR